MKSKKQPKLCREETVSNSTLKLFRGDIIQIGGGVMVCPTNSNLSKLGGICSYIIESGGQTVLLDLSNKKREGIELGAGEFVVTSGGLLQVNRLVHVCIPAYDRSDPEPLIKSTISNLLNYLEVLQVNSIVIPCLTKDVFGFTPDNCAYAYFTSILEYLSSHPNTGFNEFKIVCKDKKECKPFESQADRNFGKKEKKGLFSIFKKKKKTKEIERTVGLELGEERKDK
jgi:O-acetyl-ADP-ribose deacetylase (regulator of RNase III)